MASFKVSNKVLLFAIHQSEWGQDLPGPISQSQKFSLKLEVTKLNRREANYLAGGGN